MNICDYRMQICSSLPCIKKHNRAHCTRLLVCGLASVSVNYSLKPNVAVAATTMVSLYRIWFWLVTPNNSVVCENDLPRSTTSSLSDNRSFFRNRAKVYKSVLLNTGGIIVPMKNFLFDVYK